MKINTSPEEIKEIITKGVENLYPDREAFKKTLASGKRIKVYCGYDPTTPTLHLGHLPTILKLSRFQKMGHEVVLLIGDFTALIGDPTGKVSPRKKLDREEVISNYRHYKKTVGNFLDLKGKNPAQILFNSQWLDKINFADLINLASNFTVQQIIVRDFFQERIRKKKPIFLHEFLYPLAQAYDSVSMDIDLEVGGKDQTFNMLCGRDLMKALKKKEKFVMALKLLTDPAGRKMGKTEGNLVALDEKPNEMYGKIMSWPDSLISIGLELCTNLSSKEIKTIEKLQPREKKARLAREIVTLCHNKIAAQVAEKEFNKVFKEKKLPTKIQEIAFERGAFNILDLLNKIKIVQSKSEARRLVVQRGVRIDRKLETDWRKNIKINKGTVIQVGKRKFIRIK